MYSTSLRARERESLRATGSVGFLFLQSRLAPARTGRVLDQVVGRFDTQNGGSPTINTRSRVYQPAPKS